MCVCMSVKEQVFLGSKTVWAVPLCSVRAVADSPQLQCAVFLLRPTGLVPWDEKTLLNDIVFSVSLYQIAWFSPFKIRVLFLAL